MATAEDGAPRDARAVVGLDLAVAADGRVVARVRVVDDGAPRAAKRPRRAPAAPAASGAASGAASAGNPAYLVFDVETDGGSPTLVIQLAFIVFDDKHREVARGDELLRLPAGRTINPFSIGVHGITDQKLRDKGGDPVPALDAFFEWVGKVRAVDGRVVAHNAAGDAKHVTHTAAHYGLAHELLVVDCFCTMRCATRRCGLVTPKGRLKPPKNAELYEVLHGHAPNARLHDALEDVRVTAASYQAGRRAGWW